MRRAALAVALALTSLARAASAGDDPAAIARELAERFVAACETGKPAEALALYADDAVAVYPGEGLRANGKIALAQVLAELCSAGLGTSRWVGGSASWLGPGQDAIVASGEWETSGAGPDGKPASVRVRTTELLVKTPAGWRYRIDHASVGVQAPAEPEPTPRTP